MPRGRTELILEHTQIVDYGLNSCLNLRWQTVIYKKLKKREVRVRLVGRLLIRGTSMGPKHTFTNITKCAGIKVEAFKGINK